VDTPPTEREIRAQALRHARNTWRRFIAYAKRFMVKYGSTAGEAPSPEAYFNNRLYEDTFAKVGGANPLPNGKKIETRQILADPIMAFRASLEDPSEFDAIFAESLARRMPGHKVVISKAMSASQRQHEKDSLRTFVTKL